MGRAYIVYLYDNEIRKAARSEEKWEELSPELGDAILSVCLDPDEKLMPEEGILKKVQRVTSHRLGNHANSVNSCDRAHTDDLNVYGWSGNRLAELSDLEDGEVRDVLAEVMEEARKRGFDEEGLTGGSSAQGGSDE
jgi:hypothetical protein